MNALEGFDLLEHARNGAKHMNLVCIIASVIRDTRRLRYFRMLLDSIVAQKVFPTQLIISVHIDPSLTPDWDALFRGLPASGVLICKQMRAKRQFVQIREMLGRIKHISGKETFVMFSDDDDLWHPQRAAVYFAYYDLVDEQTLRMTSSFVVREYTASSQGPPCTACLAHNEQNVDAMIACGCVNITSYSDTENRLYEYHQYAVRPLVMEAFFKQYAQLVETNRFADMQFRYFVATYGGTEWRTCQIGAAHWTYYYRECDSTYTAVTRPCAGKTGRELAESVIEYYLELVACPCICFETAKNGLLKSIAHFDAELVRYIITTFFARLKK